MYIRPSVSNTDNLAKNIKKVTAKTVNLEFQIAYQLAAPLGIIDVLMYVSSICIVKTPHFRCYTKCFKLPFENCFNI